ncbi:MAG: serine--tRNA ligase [Chitinophagales bacterium]|nr:serine--tRNA ligase [Chitinophagales bacterium]MCZ2394564.1 serine--tRNA ligase [Chitinophagales bacterium]
MLQLEVLKSNPSEVKARLAKKNFQQLELVDIIIAIDEKRRATKSEIDTLLSERNKLSKEIGLLVKNNDPEAEKVKTRVSEIKFALESLELTFQNLEQELHQNLVLLPNLPADIVPAGKTAEDNFISYQVDNIPSAIGGALPHWELAKKYNIIDFELGTKLTGPGFPVYKGKGAILQRALINFFLFEAASAGYTEMMVPHMVNEESAFATGQLPDKEGQMYHATVDNFYLIPTAEVPLTNIYRDTILEEKDFPIKITGYTPCFRREAGSYGKDVRGLNRLHQFDKVEIVQIQHPEKSYQTLDEMCMHVENLLKKLQLPYRILRLCGGDMSFASALTYDFEVYSVAQERWLEVSSVSNFETFQSNRLKLRYRTADNKKILAHTLNGSAMALPRVLAAILEINQSPEGIKIPSALQKYTGFEMID